MNLAIDPLVLIDPFAQALSMREATKSLDVRSFATIYGYASVLSLGVYVLFALTGKSLFTRVFRVGLDTFHVFGGLVILLIALRTR